MTNHVIALRNQQLHESLPTDVKTVVFEGLQALEQLQTTISLSSGEA
jgi:hypothetical protein